MRTLLCASLLLILVVGGDALVGSQRPDVCRFTGGECPTCSQGDGCTQVGPDEWKCQPCGQPVCSSEAGCSSTYTLLDTNSCPVCRSNCTMCDTFAAKCLDGSSVSNDHVCRIVGSDDVASGTYPRSRRGFATCGCRLRQGQPVCQACPWVTEDRTCAVPPNCYLDARPSLELSAPRGCPSKCKIVCPCDAATCPQGTECGLISSYDALTGRPTHRTTCEPNTDSLQVPESCSIPAPSGCMLVEGEDGNNGCAYRCCTQKEHSACDALTEACVVDAGGNSTSCVAKACLTGTVVAHNVTTVDGHEVCERLVCRSGVFVVQDTDPTPCACVDCVSNVGNALSVGASVPLVGSTCLNRQCARQGDGTHALEERVVVQEGDCEGLVWASYRLLGSCELATFTALAQYVRAHLKWPAVGVESVMGGVDGSCVVVVWGRFGAQQPGSNVNQEYAALLAQYEDAISRAGYVVLRAFSVPNGASGAVASPVMACVSVLFAVMMLSLV